jgi:hypothetical protein
MPLKQRYILFIYVFLTIVCSNPGSHLEQALELAGENRPELEKVLSHYSQSQADSLKYKAACFLIENMPGHYSNSNIQQLNEFYDRVDSTIQSCKSDSLKDVKILLADLFSEYSSLSLKNSSRYQYNNLTTT